MLTEEDEYKEEEEEEVSTSNTCPQLRMTIMALVIFMSPSQVFASAISKFGNVDLKCTYQFHDDVRYQDALGR